MLVAIFARVFKIVFSIFFVIFVQVGFTSRRIILLSRCEIPPKER